MNISLSRHVNVGKQSRLLIVLISFLLINFSCAQQYGYLSKQKVSRRMGTVQLHIKRLDTYYLSKKFELQVEEYCAQQLRDLGYVPIKDTAKYDFILWMRIDSFENRNRAFVGPDAANLPRLPYKYELNLEMSLAKPRTGLVFWENSFKYYFFDIYERDIKRSKGILKFMIGDLGKQF